MQQWADEVGDSSYSFQKLLPYYEKSVNYTPPSLAYKNSSNVQATGAFEASGGPLHVSFGKYEDPFGTVSQMSSSNFHQCLLASLRVPLRMALRIW